MTAIREHLKFVENEDLARINQKVDMSIGLKSCRVVNKVENMAEFYLSLDYCPPNSITALAVSFR